MNVRVYTRGDQVKLLLNGKDVGSKDLTEKDALRAEFTVPYSPGELKASRDDLSYVIVQVVDEAGRPVPDAVVKVSFAVTGAGEIAAVGNANPKDVASFRQPRRDTFHGTCAVVVRPIGKPGAIEVRAESPGLESTAVRLEVVG